MSVVLGSAAFIYWVGSPQSIHGGASTLVYGFSFYLFSHGVFLSGGQKPMSMALTVILIASGLFLGLFPSAVAQVSWEGHVGGALSGFIVALVYFVLFDTLPVL